MRFHTNGALQQIVKYHLQGIVGLLGLVQLHNCHLKIKMFPQLKTVNKKGTSCKTSLIQ